MDRREVRWCTSRPLYLGVLEVRAVGSCRNQDRPHVREMFDRLLDNGQDWSLTVDGLLSNSFN